MFACHDSYQRVSHLVPQRPPILLSTPAATAATVACTLHGPTQTPSETWRDAQAAHVLSPFGTRVLVFRRRQETPQGIVVEEGIMDRVDAPHRWNLWHVRYREYEASPLPVSKKRKRE